jgi:hypothetical protein
MAFAEVVMALNEPPQIRRNQQESSNNRPTTSGHAMAPRYDCHHGRRFGLGRHCKELVLDHSNSIVLKTSQRRSMLATVACS